jgi:hypothetical protein
MKSEILSELKANGNVSKFQQNPTWEKAFKLYNESHPSDKKNMRCGSCFRTVLKWLQS